MLTVTALTKTFAGHTSGGRKSGPKSERVYAVDDVSFTVEEGELFTLLGPSGCGKTTTLRSIAGLDTPDQGSIVLAGRVLFDSTKGVRVPANQRQLGMVFQSYAIWPHMTVFENVVFPLKAMPRRTRLSSSKMREEVERILTVMQLESYASRPATNLSGGQQQRLALARALVMRPKVLLLDEPLSNLDAKLRESLRFELKRLQRESGQTSIYVTHDQSEALALSSRVAVVRNGQIMQIGKPREIYDRPVNRFVAEFVGTANFLSGKIETINGTTVVVATECGSIIAGAGVDGYQVGDEVTISVRPEAFSICARAQAPSTALIGVVRNRAFLGDVIDHVVEVKGLDLRIRCNPSTSLETGTEVGLMVEPERALIIPVSQ